MFEQVALPLFYIIRIKGCPNYSLILREGVPLLRDNIWYENFLSSFLLHLIVSRMVVTFILVSDYSSSWLTFNIENKTARTSASWLYCWGEGHNGKWLQLLDICLICTYKWSSSYPKFYIFDSSGWWLGQIPICFQHFTFDL